MKATLASITVVVCMCLIGQAASGFVITPNTALVILSGCDSGYLVKDCGNRATITKVKDYSVNLKESIKMDSGDKKQDTKQDAKEKKPVAKKVVKSSKYKSCDKYKDNSKKYSACKKSVDKKLLKQQSQKTKNDTVKNSIGNIR